jgi:dihydroorotase-like cyclic amidohydrolase
MLNPLTSERVSLRIAQARVAERASSLPGGGQDIDGSELWTLPGLYDADEHTPFSSVGLRDSDRFAALSGGITTLTVAVQWQDVRGLDLGEIAAQAASHVLPRIVPILSVSDSDTEGFADWIAQHGPTVASLFPAACKLYSTDPNFWLNLAAVWAADLLPVIYCFDADAISGVIERARRPVHFRHAISAELVRSMRRLSGATLQTSPHFVLPVPKEVRDQLWVLPPVSDDGVRSSLLGVLLDEIDLLVSDHNAPPFLGQGRGPGLQVAHSFLPALLMASELNEWPLERVLAKATSAPAARFGVTLGESFTIVDPHYRAPGELWPRQTPDRAPFAQTPLRGRVLAAGVADRVCLI